MISTKISIIAGLVLLPNLLFATTDCHVVDYPDHYVAVCVGDEKNVPEQGQQSVTNQAPAPAKSIVKTKSATAPKTTVPPGQASVTAQTAATPQSAATGQPVATQMASMKVQELSNQSPLYNRLRLSQKAVRDAAIMERARLIKAEQQKQLDKPNESNSDQSDMPQD